MTAAPKGCRSCGDFSTLPTRFRARGDGAAVAAPKHMRFALLILLASVTSARAAPSDVNLDGLLDALVGADGVIAAGFGIADLAGARGTGYGAGEIAYNATAATAYAHVLLDADDGHEAVVGAAGAVVHDALVLHGVATIAAQRAWPLSTTLVFGGTLLSTELFFPPPDDDNDDPPSRHRAIAAVAANAPLALGYAYRAYRDFHTGHSGLGGANVTGAVLVSTMASMYVTAKHPHTHGVTPTVVDDGHGDVALGIGIHGRLR